MMTLLHACRVRSASLTLIRYECGYYMCVGAEAERLRSFTPPLLSDYLELSEELRGEN
jgi:hypothetical protein